MKQSFFFVLCFTLLHSIFQHASAQNAPNYKDSLTLALQTIHKQGHINGFGVAIVDAKGLLYSNGIGFADRATEQPYSSTTLQNIGSVSKTIIGIALLKAQEEGLLQLDDPINKYLPFKVKNPYFPKAPITIRQLSTHTSTITDTEYYDQQAYLLKQGEELAQYDLSNVGEQFHDQDPPLSMEQFLKNLLTKKGDWYQKSNFLSKPPGSTYEYSNVGATLAAYVLEQATGKSFSAYTQEHVLQALGMNSSGWSFDHINLAQHSTLYAAPTIPLPKYSLVTYPDGGLITSPADIGLYLTELIKAYSGAGTLLAKKSYQAIFKEQLSDQHFPEDRSEEDLFDDEYNSGIFMGFTPKYIGHTGGDPGISAFLFFDPKTNIGQYMAINTSIINQEGVQQFFSIWGAMDKYAALIQTESRP